MFLYILLGLFSWSAINDHFKEQDTERRHKEIVDALKETA